MSDQKKKKPMSALDYIKYQPHLQGKPLTIPQTSSALAEYPPLTYAEAATPEKAQTLTPIQETKKSEYFQKPQKEHILTTPYTKPITLKQLQTFINRIFYEDGLYLTDNPIKNRTFYEYILVDSKSVEITHYPDKNNPNHISYSTCKILRIASMQDLVLFNPFVTKPFSQLGYHIPGYNYRDYQFAFFRIFFLRSYDHSWFISFDHNCQKTAPGWFAEWWYWFGPTTEIYPNEIIKTSYPFYKKQIPTPATESFAKYCFHIDMGIPWICSWHFTLEDYLPEHPLSLVRKYQIKWWDKYNLDRCSLTNIQKFFHTHKQIQTAIQTVSKSIPLVTPNQFTLRPTTKTPPSTVKQPSPTTSADSSSSKKSSKKEKLKQMIHELMDSSDEEDTMQQDDLISGQDPFELG